MFLVAANLPILEMKSPMTAHLLLAAHCAASDLLAGVAWWGLKGSRDLGKAEAKRVEIASVTMRLVSGGGKFGDGWIRSARRCGRVGVW